MWATGHVPMWTLSHKPVYNVWGPSNAHVSLIILVRSPSSRIPHPTFLFSDLHGLLFYTSMARQGLKAQLHACTGLSLDRQLPKNDRDLLLLIMK